ncbi:transcriptional regulator ATRX-like [Ptychodera flava]|uniref:transcriptional regulator ATRX-like n=1 Tax=Ptychodera flava TaxID=63121 RepID=UPI00396A339A
MGGKRVPSDYSEERIVKLETSESGMVHSESDRAKVKAGYKMPTKRRRSSQDEDNSAQGDDQANAGGEENPKQRLLYHVRDNSKYRNVLAEIVTLRKDNPQNQFIMKSIEDNKIIHARTIWFKGGCFPRGMGGKRVPSDYSEERIVKLETSESGMVHSESDRAKVTAGYKAPTKRRRVSQDEDNSEQEEDHAKPGIGAPPKRSEGLLYHVRDNRGCFPRGMGGKRVPSDYSEERIVKLETSESGMVRSESDRAKVKAGYKTPTKRRRVSQDEDNSEQEEDHAKPGVGAQSKRSEEYIIPPKIRRSSHDKDDSTQEDDQTKVGAEAQFKIGEAP